MNGLEQQKQKVALVIGAGDATGGAIAKRFAKGGYITCMTRRNAEKLQPLIEEIEQAGGVAYGFASDARKEEQVMQLVEEIESNIGEIDIWWCFKKYA
ncbi:SDR family NAD(P)-dependent oxidoreductase, partial [Acinetobacter piscicola]|uniref:SDR family NAD(P)-dependent oxidoreductase n=1 Tax=Acinetobacter piscicola TaxID=2006115 RepID=UPI0012FF8EE4